MITHRITHRILPLLLAAASQLASAQTMVGTDPVKIFILAGESNMHGKGTVSPATTQGTLDYIVANDPTGKYQFLGTVGNYVTRTDVGIRSYPYLVAEKLGNLTINYGGNALGLIGPELGFGHVLGDAYQNKILIVKVGVDATTLGGSFCPPSSRIGEPEPVVAADKGYYYKEIIRRVNEAKTFLGATPHEVAGLGWHQGWNDRVNAAFSAAYETNMTNFINNIRTDLAAPNMPVVIASAAMDEGLAYSEVERAQLKMANSTAYPAFAGNVATVNTRIKYEDLEFWQSVAKSPANEGYHWNRSGKTFLHIGMAMGDAMSLIATNRIPSRIRSSGSSSGTTLTWKNGTETPTSVRVLRNNVEIAAAAPVNPPTFVDNSAPLGVSNYELQFTMPGAAAQPLTVSQNTNISELQANDRINGIKLTWRNNRAYSAIQVKRGGTIIAASLPGNTTSYLDRTPTSGATTYTVEPTDVGNTPTSVQITVSASPRGTALVYEPFDMTAATTLNEKPGGFGLDGTWVSGNDVQVTAGNFSFGALPVFGNRIVRTASNGSSSINIGPSLSEAGLLDHGAELWFSFLCPNPNDSNVHPTLAIGNEALASNTSVNNAGNAIGVRINGGTTVQGLVWNGGGVAATSATQATLAASEMALVVGKITWGANAAAVDTIQIYTPASTNLLLDTPQSTSAVVDQSTFNTLSMWGNGTAPNLDEIRFGATFEDVIGTGTDTSADLTPPTPATMSFVTPPTAVTDASITMTATTATDANSVQYRFHNTTRNTFSSWQNSPTFTDTGLTALTSYSYTVQARDKSVNQNENTASPTASATTLAQDLVAPPTPGFATAPTAISATAITMTAATVVDPEASPVQYRFHNTTLGTNSGWQTATTFIFNGLIPSTSYTFTVQARDSASVPNESPQSAALSATTNGPTNGTWGFDADGTWSDSSKWNSNLIAVGSGATAFFTQNISAARTVTLSAPQTIGNITFTDSTSSNNDLSINGASALTLDVASGAPVIDVTQSGRSLTFNCLITGNDGLQKNGVGRLAPSANNTYTGTTTVTAGQLDLAAVGLTFGGGSGRNISVSTGAAIRRNGLDNTFLNRLVENSNEFTVMTGTTSNNLDFSSSTGANLPNAFLGNYAGNGAKCEYTGTLTPASDAYRLGGAGSNGLLGIRSTLTGARGIIVSGNGIRVNLVAANTHTGDTVINTGARLSLGNNLALQNSALDVGSAGGSFSCAAGTNAGKITGETAASSPTLGGLKGSRALLTVFSISGGNNETNLAATAVTGFTLNPGTGQTCTYSGVIANFAPATTLTKTGLGTQTLSGANAYTGATNINQGTLTLVGGSQQSPITVAAGASLGFTLGSPTTSNSSLNLTTGTVKITGAVNNSSDYLLMTASTITGTPVLDSPITNYQLQKTAGNTQLKLVYVPTSAYVTWKTANAPTGNPDDDYDGDGVENAVEFLLGGLATTNDLAKLPTLSTSGGNMTFTFNRATGSIDPGKTTVTIEVSSDLVTWATPPSPYAVPDTATGPVNPGVTVVEDTSPGFDTVTLRLPQDVAKKFARLNVVITS